MDYVHAMAPMANIILYEANSQSLAALMNTVQTAEQSECFGRNHELVRPRFQQRNEQRFLLHDARHEGHGRQEHDVYRLDGRRRRYQRKSG